MTNRDLSDELHRNIPLSEMIQTLRQELMVALESGKDSRMRFLPKKVELELQIVVERERSAGGKIAIGVLEAEGKVGKKQGDTHLFRLELEPRWLTPEGSLSDILIGDPANPRPQQE
jgi:NTP-dependent ternary system trypsin peptidase co-occuring protein